MADAPGGHDLRPRHWLVDALFGGGLALGLITAANASLPRVMSTYVPHPARVLAPPDKAARPAAPVDPPALIAFREPAPGYPVISPFGLRRLPWEKSGRLHAGVDIAAPLGAPVLAAADGVVTRIATDPGYGQFVEVRHAAGLVTRYGHLARRLGQIRSGLAVKAGQPLGEMGSTGTSTGSHLHFEVRDSRGRPLNPELFLGRSFATAADLPLIAASRFPRGVRVAYVSRIPRSKRDQMQAKVEFAAAAEAMQAGVENAASASDAAVDAADASRRTAGGRDRPHGRFRAHREG